MFPTSMSNSTSLSQDASVHNHVPSTIFPQQQPQKIKRKRSLPGNPDPDAEVIALSPKTLLATNRFVCEICHKGFQRDQNLQLHRRGHNLPWKLKQRSNKEVKKKAYVCPEPSCVHHNPSRALGDLTGIKKHYCRKHGEKKWKCEKCSKIYAVQSDWKAHSKTCGTREYRCDCGTLFSRKDSFITHRAFCDALAEESARLSSSANPITNNNPLVQSLFLFQNHGNDYQYLNNNNPWDSSSYSSLQQNPNPINNNNISIASSLHHIKPEASNFPSPPSILRQPKTMITSPVVGNHQHFLHVPPDATSAYMSATALLQKAATVGAAAITGNVMGQQREVLGHVTRVADVAEFGGAVSNSTQLDSVVTECASMTKSDRRRLTRDFLGLSGDADGSVNDMLSFAGGAGAGAGAGGVEYYHHALLKPQHGFGFVGLDSNST